MGWFVHGAESGLEGSFVQKEEGYSHGTQWHCVSNCHRVLWRLAGGESLSPNSLSSLQGQRALFAGRLVQPYHRSSWLKEGDAEQTENTTHQQIYTKFTPASAPHNEIHEYPLQEGGFAAYSISGV